MNKKGNNNGIFLTIILTFFIVLCHIFRTKNIYLEPNHILEASISCIIYPFTFLFTLLINKKIGFNSTHKTIIKSSLLFLLFVILITLLNNITSTKDTIQFDIILKQLFTPNTFIIKNHIFYYPDILSIIVFTLLFYFSHTILVVLYEAMEPFTYSIIAYFLAMFIPYTLDTLCYVTIMDVFKEVEFNKIILHLTSNFVLVIIFTILLTLIFKSKKVN